MKKILFLSICLLLLSGCQAEYNLYIGNSISEDLIITATDNSENNLLKTYKGTLTANIDDQISSESNEKIDGIEYYDIYFDDGLNFKYNFSNSNYLKSSIVNTCYRYFNFVDDKNTFTLSTTKEFLCFNLYPSLDNVKVNITTSSKIEEHNADAVNGNIYTWILTKDSSDNSIYMYTNKTKEQISDGEQIINPGDQSSTENGEEKKNNENEYIYVLVGLGLFGIVLLISFKIKK